MENLMGIWVAEQAFAGHLNAIFINTGEEFEVIKIEDDRVTIRKDDIEYETELGIIQGFQKRRP